MRFIKKSSKNILKPSPGKIYIYSFPLWRFEDVVDKVTTSEQQRFLQLIWLRLWILK